MVDKPEKKSAAVQIVNRINENSRRIRLLEQKAGKIEDSIAELDKNILTQISDLKVDLERANSKINSIAERLSMIETEIVKINKELAKAATKIEVKQLESFIDLISPLTSKFVTKSEMEKFLQARIAKKA